MKAEGLPDGIDPGQVLRVLSLAHEQAATAMWLSAGMFCAFCAMACAVLGWRRASLACGFLYFLSLCFVRNGHAQLLGPLGCSLAAAGIAWPGRRRP